jgi:pyridoxine 5-phosphate synthase
MTRLSVNINKFATLRNARGANNPNIIQVALDAEKFGADGITVHPRPDERHIRFKDVYDLKKIVKTEFNIEGNPTPAFIEMVLEIKPDQVTLVPDDVNALTSDHGWDSILHLDFLRATIQTFKSAGIRVSIFCDADTAMVAGAAKTGTDRIELYTGPYAEHFHINKETAIAAYIAAALQAAELGLGVNAGHDLDLHNLAYFKAHIPQLTEVSIGHALICDSLYLGLEKTIQLYKNAVQ